MGTHKLNNSFYFSVGKIEDCIESNCFQSEKWHHHDYYTLFIIDQGNGLQTIDFEAYDLLNHSAYFLTPGQIHAFENASVTGYFILFNLDFYHLVKSQLKLYDFPFFHSSITAPYLSLNNGYETVISIVKLIYEEFQQNTFAKWSVLRAELEILLIHLTRIKQNQSSEEDTLLIPNNEKLRKLELLIDENFIREKKVTFYANQLNITSRHLNSIVKEKTGKSISDMLHQRTLIEACRLLMNTEKTVAEIAYDLNFNDKAYFHRYFKKHKGITPQQFRDQFLKVHH